MWMQPDSDYRKILAAMDMFLWRFPEHPLSVLRLGTLGARMKDCTALMKVVYAAKVTGKTVNE